jgi:hypothetical protein
MSLPLNFSRLSVFLSVSFSALTASGVLRDNQV